MEPPLSVIHFFEGGLLREENAHHCPRSRAFPAAISCCERGKVLLETLRTPGAVPDVPERMHPETRRDRLLHEQKK